jgi:predicted pyridoxine 5'-phosphate oxidase superfamily flavin-nucleotide-binding protein
MTLPTELEDAIRTLRIAENHFNEAVDPEQVEIATHEYTAALQKYDEAIRRLKAQVAVTVSQQGKPSKEVPL